MSSAQGLCRQTGTVHTGSPEEAQGLNGGSSLAQFPPTAPMIPCNFLSRHYAFSS